MRFRTTVQAWPLAQPMTIGEVTGQVGDFLVIDEHGQRIVPRAVFLDLFAPADKEAKALVARLKFNPTPTPDDVDTPAQARADAEMDARGAG